MMSHTALALTALGASGAGVVLSALTLRTAHEWVTMAVTLLAVATACVVACTLGVLYFTAGGELVGVVLYQWALPGLGMQVGILVDALSVLMLAVVTVVSLLVHIYSIGYMRGDDGRARFFCYLALFTFAMLLLVLADNFLLLFIGWEGVGVASWLLIGFWYTRERAASASLKAFLINRLGDFGFLLAICAVFAAVGSLDYAASFASAERLAESTGPGGVDWLTIICLLLFFGAMGKSAQMPLHAWLPDSMEGPTPISAMIHAATMVTAGIFMVARLSPLYEHSAVALSVMLFIGAVTALATGLLGLVANDIKRVLAYSTLSQLGYMVAALGVSAYAASIFHLFTHAFFKALLFLAAGSVIIALHHEQDIRRMGGLARRLPWTTLCFAIGTLALIGMPGFAGFFSKESIIEAVAHSSVPGAEIALYVLLAGVVVTALYMLRLWGMAFMGTSRVPISNVREPDWSVRGPLVILTLLTLASPLAMEALLIDGALSDALFVAAGHDTLAALVAGWQGLIAHTTHALTTLPVLLLGGTIVAWIVRPLWAWLARALTPKFIVRMLENQYGFDALYERIIPRVALRTGTWFAQTTDRRLIDGALVMGSAALAQRAAAQLRRVHTGLLNHYALGMLLGLALAIGYLLIEV